MVTKLKDYTPTQFDASSLGDKFPEFADWGIVKIMAVGSGYPYPKKSDEVLTVRHWQGSFYVHVRPPKTKESPCTSSTSTP